METALAVKTFENTLDVMLVIDLNYTHDICPLEDCPVKTQKMLDLVTTRAAEVELSISFPRMIPLQCKIEPVEAVQEFIYLGSKKQLDGNITSEIKTRIVKAAGSFKIFSNLWNQRSLPSLLKIKMYNACVRSFLLHVYESRPIKQSDINMNDSFENMFIKRIIPRGHALSTKN